MADYSGTIAATDVAQTVTGFNPRRKTIRVYADENNAADLWLLFGGTATKASPSIRFHAGDEKFLGRDFHELVCRSISVIGAQNDVFSIETGEV